MAFFIVRKAPLFKAPIFVISLQSSKSFVGSRPHLYSYSLLHCLGLFAACSLSSINRLYKMCSSSPFETHFLHQRTAAFGVPKQNKTTTCQTSTTEIKPAQTAHPSHQPIHPPTNQAKPTAQKQQYGCFIQTPSIHLLRTHQLPPQQPGRWQQPRNRRPRLPHRPPSPRKTRSGRPTLPTQQQASLPLILAAFLLTRWRRFSGFFDSEE